MKKYSVVAVGGTFDHLHEGHKLLLTHAVGITTKILCIGISDGDLLQNKQYRDKMEPYQQREKTVLSFCRALNPKLQITAIPIRDPNGKADQIKNLEALVVSTETIESGEKINRKRIEDNLKPVDLIIIEPLESMMNKDGDRIVTSTNIRRKLTEK